MFKKKKTGKTRKYTIKCSDYGIVLLLNFIKDSISVIKNDISNSLDQDELKDWISEKYVLMDIAHQLGITIYDEEIKDKKSLASELKEVLKRNKDAIKNVVPEVVAASSITNEEKVLAASLDSNAGDDEVF